MDAACLPAAQMLRITTEVLLLGERVAAGDLAAVAQAEAIAALLERKS